VLATHHHDDHVAGMNLLRAVEGTEVWAPAHVAAVLEEPQRFDLPCLWHDPVPVDRRLGLGETVSWREHQITVHDLPGHSRYAAAYEVTVDGVTVLATGDQQLGTGVTGGPHEVLNYQYRSLFRPEDYRASAALYRRVAPDLILSGHWGARWVDEDYLDLVSRAGEAVVGIHRDLLPDDLDLPADSILARIDPYRSEARVDDLLSLTVSVTNPYDARQRARIRLVLPEMWHAVRTERHVDLAAGQTRTVTFPVTVRGVPAVRRRVAVELTIGALRLGQHAEALVDVWPADEVHEEAGCPQ